VSLIANHRSRRDVAERWSSILVGLAVVFVVGWMTLEAAGPPRPRHISDAGAASAASSASTSVSVVDAGTAELDAGLALEPSLLGTLPSAMPSGAPRHVKIGVVLISFAGAEGAPPNARSKRDALALADRLLQEARSDFHHAVSNGDPGSSDDVGRLPRGVLDPRTELAVFALGNGEVSEVLDTPRGYWIAKRLE
jgi:hypothetical protein